MIGIQLDGDSDFLETKQDTSISVKLENPFLGDDVDKLSPGSFSYPFNLPGGEVSPSNAARLKNPDVIENNEAYQLQKATLFFGGVPWKAGNLKSKESANSDISSYFTFGLNNIHPYFKTAKLRDILSAVYLISITGRMKEIFVDKVDGVTESSVSVNGQLYTCTTTADLINAINDTFEDSAILDDANSWFPVAMVESSVNTPLGYIPTYLRIRMARRVTSGTLLPEGFHVSFSTDPLIPLSITMENEEEVQWYVEAFDMSDYYGDFEDFLLPYFNETTPDNLVRWPLIYNDNLHPEGFKDSLVINGVNAAGIRKNNPNYGLSTGIGLHVYNENSLQPFLLLKGILDKIAVFFDFEYEGDFYDDPDTATRIFDNAITLDVPIEFIGQKKFIFWRRSFNVNELIPDISVVDFFKLLRSRYNIAVYFNEVTKRVRLQYREPIAGSNTYDDITSLLSPIEGTEDVRITGFIIKVPREETDAFSTQEFWQEGVSEKEYEVKIGRLFSTLSQVIDGKTLTGPYKSQPNNEKGGLRIFHYLGINDSGSFEHAEAALNGVKDETLLGVNGIYDQRWKYWIFFETRRVIVKLKGTFPFRRLLQFDWELKRRFNRTNYLVKSMDVKLSNKGMSPMSIELYTMK